MKERSNGLQSCLIVRQLQLTWSNLGCFVSYRLKNQKNDEKLAISDFSDPAQQIRMIFRNFRAISRKI